ncbi:NAD-dependent epimerase/dehydratase family protein [Candidatus Pelagibacter sp. HIMB1485]|uniref:NAD-dependent epimerase/dehydratase family protein n=1 Tax=Candidatus Pelagibacter sp. HIMB1485 TaxID=3415415 RepID=UPI003F87FBDC
MKNVLITGHNGFLGKVLIKKLKNKKLNVFGISRGINPSLECVNYFGDVTDLNRLHNIMSSKSIDTVIHLAGKAIVSECEESPFDAFKVNGLGTAAVLEASRITHVKKIISVETDKVYGKQKIMPTPETSKLNPGGPYEFSKVLSAEISDFYRKYYKMNIISVRPANLIGGGDHNTTRIMPNAFRHILQGKGIPIYEEAKKMTRDFIYVSDVAEALYILSKRNNKHYRYNLSPNKKINIYEFGKLINKTLKCKVPPQIIKKNIKFKEIPEQSIDGSLFEKEYNFKYTDLKTIIKKSFLEYKKNIV